MSTWCALLAEQLPEVAGGPLTPVASTGTVSALVRCGGDLVVRLPVRPGATVAERRHEQDACRFVAGAMAPLAVPEPVLLARPTPAFPHPWSVVRWLPGRPARRGLDPAARGPHAWRSSSTWGGSAR